MIDHVGIRVKDYEKSKAFYQKALQSLGYEMIAEYDGACGFGTQGKPDFWIGENEGSTQAHVAITAPSHEAVDKFYDAAIAAGARDNGKPGLRKDYHPNYYAAFVIDQDGNNIEAVCHKK